MWRVSFCHVATGGYGGFFALVSFLVAMDVMGIMFSDLDVPKDSWDSSSALKLVKNKMRDDIH